jgi:hypothetical protein
MEGPRCGHCRRRVAGGTHVCGDVAECARVRSSWEWSPCPVERCEFPGTEHVALLLVDASTLWTCPDGWETIRKGVEF